MLKTLIVYGLLTLNGKPLENQGFAIFGTTHEVLAQSCTDMNGFYRLEAAIASSKNLKLVCKAWNDSIYFSAVYSIENNVDSIQKNVSITKDSLIEIVLSSDLIKSHPFPEYVCFQSYNFNKQANILRVSCPEEGEACFKKEKLPISIFVRKGFYHLYGLSVSSTSFSLDNKHAHHIIVNKFRRININKKGLFIKRKKHIKLLYR